ncbi:hypothetical protein FB382_003778 [Nocardioides ginsengisegetis]|uniref:Uncharacterized protein n=1 Tax=Nocardioides ginsengisegetis TaxID=661491 RepID=A0A7W3J372_9ACTN|nr:hypothetical protein [Nocardioides ginsengisegetis]MBA8805487.1 hypothetical protein [Nocardioides ginsengisegetis]
MNEAVPDWKWGAWVLGDMADVLRRACDAVGRATDVVRVEAAPPRTSEELPQVTLVIPSERGLFRLRTEIAESEYPVRFIGRPTGQRWTAEVLGVRLVVTLEAGDAS